MTNSLFYLIKTPDSAKEITETGSNKLLEILMWILEKAPLVLGAIAVLFLTVVIGKLLKRIAIKSLSKRNTDDQVILLVGKATYITTLILGITIALNILGIDIAAIVGLVGLGVSFALQDVIKNFVCGALILIQQPFKIGDVIEVNGYLGKVEAIEARSTNIKTFDGQRVIIPNGDTFSSSVINFSAHPERRLEIVVGVSYETDLALASQILLNTVNNDSNILNNPAPAILLTEFADSAINVSIKFWVDKDSNIFGIRSELIRQIKVAFDASNINIPFPITTLDLPESNNKNNLDKAILNR